MCTLSIIILNQLFLRTFLHELNKYKLIENKTINL
jgi:hypothetical protein